ncbi:hypothetical protein EXIGLDRAFT_702732 [Exidia glandulosa HHB12029]|uniref:Uncharacterized protein n=1 Tax=Exidia glandulosa HHB12029 TaxID=1314781 RepID=A0A165CE51_EXIGL|nr:hypothetical protein EXIGLDRAFT_702732 [Exidia glandulosa HHB12029]
MEETTAQAAKPGPKKIWSSNSSEEWQRNEEFWLGLRESGAKPLVLMLVLVTVSMSRAPTSPRRVQRIRHSLPTPNFESALGGVVEVSDGGVPWCTRCNLMLTTTLRNLKGSPFVAGEILLVRAPTQIQALFFTVPSFRFIPVLVRSASSAIRSAQLGLVVESGSELDEENDDDEHLGHSGPSTSAFASVRFAFGGDVAAGRRAGWEWRCQESRRRKLQAAKKKKKKKRPTDADEDGRVETTKCRMAMRERASGSPFGLTVNGFG